MGTTSLRGYFRLLAVKEGFSGLGEGGAHAAHDETY